MNDDLSNFRKLVIAGSRLQAILDAAIGQHNLLSSPADKVKRARLSSFIRLATHALKQVDYLKTFVDHWMPPYPQDPRAWRKKARLLEIEFHYWGPILEHVESLRLLGQLALNARSSSSALHTGGESQDRMLREWVNMHKHVEFLPSETFRHLHTPRQVDSWSYDDDFGEYGYGYDDDEDDEDETLLENWGSDEKERQEFTLTESYLYSFTDDDIVDDEFAPE